MAKTVKKIVKKVKIKKPKKIVGKVIITTTLAKILMIKGADEILANNGVPCLSCPMAPMEIDDLQIGEVCKAYGLNLKKIIMELNDL
jgi:hypothetical protein